MVFWSAGALWEEEEFSEEGAVRVAKESASNACQEISLTASRGAGRGISDDSRRFFCFEKEKIRSAFEPARCFGGEKDR